MSLPNQINIKTTPFIKVYILYILISSMTNMEKRITIIV